MRTAPVQGFRAGIPWSLHLRAWDAYSAKWGRGQSAERLAERGGFHASELDGFVPGWRQEVSEIGQLREQLGHAGAAIDQLTKEREEYRARWLGSMTTRDAQLIRDENERLKAAIKPFAIISLDVLENHPGWANAVFAGEWCGYRLTYTQFEAAAAAADLPLAHEQAPGGKDAP